MKKLFLCLVIVPFFVKAQSDVASPSQIERALVLIQNWRVSDSTLSTAPIATYTQAVFGTITLMPDSIMVKVEFAQNVKASDLKICFKPAIFSTEDFDSIEVHKNGFFAYSSTFLLRQSDAVIASNTVYALVHLYYKRFADMAQISATNIEADAYKFQSKFLNWLYNGNIPDSDRANYDLCKKREREYHNLSLLSVR